MTEQPIPNGAPPGDLVGVLSLVFNRMSEMESRLLARLDDNSTVGAHRWEQHEKEHRDWLQMLEELDIRLTQHLKEARDEEVRMDARLGPIRSAGNILVREWRTVVIVLLLLWSLFDHAAEDILRWMTGT